MLLCATGTEHISNHFDGSMYLLSRAEGGRSKPLTSKYIQQIFSRTWNVPCRIDLCRFLFLYLSRLISRQIYNMFNWWCHLGDSDMLMPGEHGRVRLTLFKKMVMTGGQQFTIRENGKTVATGIVAKSLASVELPHNKLSRVEVTL